MSKVINTLIVESNATLRLELKKLLASRFPLMNLEEARDGKEAIQKISNFLPYLVFIDIQLPGKNGLKVTSEIKKSYSDIIVIAFSTYDMPEYRKAANESGANYFLSKGMSSAEDILALVDSILSKEDQKQ